MSCIKCGEKLQADADFCGSCGHKVEAASAGQASLEPAPKPVPKPVASTPTPAPKPAAKRMGIMYWYFAVLNKYAVFNGRASRTEYWMFSLFNLLILLALSFIENMLDFSRETDFTVGPFLYLFAVITPMMAVAVRRLHDTGRSAWSLLYGLIPYIGPIILIVLYVLDSNPVDNKYGPNPKLEVS